MIWTLSPSRRGLFQQRLGLVRRDLVVDAWKASATGKIGYRPEITVDDVISGKADPWNDLYGKD